MLQNAPIKTLLLHEKMTRKVYIQVTYGGRWGERGRWWGGGGGGRGKLS